MATISFRFGGVTTTPRELNWGVTRIGRADDNDVKLNHPSISAHHCQIELGLDFLLVRDLGSTNGTFIEGQPVREARLEPGQSLRLGDVEAVIERSLDPVSVPRMPLPKLPRSVRLADGTESCLNHASVRADWRCTHCGKLFCTPCIHDLHVQGGRTHKFCPNCHNEVTRIDWGARKKQKKSFWGYIKEVFRE
jgi:hypothetical protein